MKTYLMRSLRYILKMVIIIAVVFIILYFMGHLNTGSGGLLKTLFMSWRGAVLIGALLVLALSYPAWSFTTIEIKGNIVNDRREILEAFGTMEYKLEKEEDGVMYFRPKSMFKRFVLQFDDTVKVSAVGERYISVEGQKRELGRIELRLNAFINTFADKNKN